MATEGITARVEFNDASFDSYYELIVEHGGVEIARHLDRGQLEDNSFTGDYDWVAPLIEKAYALGYKDAEST